MLACGHLQTNFFQTIYGDRHPWTVLFDTSLDDFHLIQGHTDKRKQELVHLFSVNFWLELDQIWEADLSSWLVQENAKFCLQDWYLNYFFQSCVMRVTIVNVDSTGNDLVFVS